MEAIATGGAANLSSEAAKGIYHEAKRHIRYVIFYHSHVKNFKDKLAKLIEKRRSMQQDVDAAKRNVEQIKADVQGWCDKVDKLIAEDETNKVKDLQLKAQNKCFFGLCPSIKSRYRLSRKAEEDAATFDELIKDCQFNGVGYRDVPQLILHNTDFETFKSREKVFNDIVESLNDPTLRMIGVYGMPGVGKTSLVKEVYRQVHEDKLYSVVMVTVSRTPDIRGIQDEIAESLGLKLEEKTTVGRARRLCERLIQEKMILIILDDIWEKLDLEEVGIPFGSQHKGCKILLTSRNKNVLSNGMGATNTFQLGVLDDDEAWEFFKKMAEYSFESDTEVQSTAIEVAKRCAGLPLAISTVARALQKQSLFVWKEALRQLQRPYSEIPSEISAEVYSAIELSINHLRGEELKQTFLLCSLLRPCNSIDDLLRIAIGLGLISGVGTLKEARDKLLTMLSTLKASCLLLGSNTNGQFFDVHDLTYIVAKSIVSKDNQVFALNREDARTDWPDEESLKKLNKICLQYPSINRLPDQLSCPQLFLFLLFSDNLSLTLSYDFFKEATNLKVLDLTSMQFSSLPSSICLLTSLSTLCLDHCILGDDITIIGGLKSLEILSLIKSDIRVLPNDIGQLVKLKLLDVSSCAKLKIISAGVLSNLSRLEELYMGGTSIQWEQSRTTLADLHALSHLSTLEVQIPDTLTAPQDFFQELQKLERYKIFIGKEWEWEWEWFDNSQYSRTLKLSLSTGVDDLDHGIRKLLRKTEDLHLDELKGVKIALQELTDEESLLHLKNLHIQNGSDTEYIINDENEFLQLQSLTLQSLRKLISFCPQHDASATNSLPQHELPLFSEKISFPCLEQLCLESINVTKLWHNQLSTASFRSYEKLTTLKIVNCRSLKHLFSFSMAKCLRHLTDFEIIGCYSLREVIFMEEIEEETQTTMTLSLFPRLKNLKLKYLPLLIRFFSASRTQVMKSLDFKNLKVLEVEECNSLKYVFSVSMAVELVQLTFLKMKNCRMMEYIIKKGAEKTSLDTVSLPNLQEINLMSCSELTSFCMGSVTLQCPSLKNIKVDDCPKMYAMACTREVGGGEKTPFFNDKVFCVNLWYLIVKGCHNLEYLFPSSLIKNFTGLVRLNLDDCENMKEVIFTDESAAAELIVFTKLQVLQLYRLPKLETFWHGDYSETDSPTLFNEKVVFPILYRLMIRGIRKCEKIWHDEASMNSLYKLTFLMVEDCERLLNIFPSNMVKTLKKLKYVFVMECGSLKEIIGPDDDDDSIPMNRLTSNQPPSLCFLKYTIYSLNVLFPCEGLGDEDEHAGTLANMKELRLSELSLSEVFCNQEILQASGCSKLKNLVPSSVSFKHLTTLQVSKCHGFRNLVTFAAAKSMVQLTRMTVTNCLMLEEIIASTTDQVADGIIFNQLKSLELDCLPTLSRFCSGKYAMGFPSLEEVIIIRCPKIKIFTEGKLSTPMLHGLKSTNGEYVGCWEGDLNVTLQQLFAEKIFPSLEDLELSSINIQLAWKHKLLGTHPYAQNLTCLTIEGCHNLNCLFPSSMVKSFVQLKKLKVENCENVENVIIEKGLTKEEMMNQKTFRVLEFISLKDLPKLTKFCHGTYFEFPLLTSLSIQTCPALETFISDAEGNNSEIDSPALFDKKVVFPCLEEVTIIGVRNWRTIWRQQPTNDVRIHFAHH